MEELLEDREQREALIAAYREGSDLVEEALAGVTHVLHLATSKETPDSIMDVAVKGLFWARRQADSAGHPTERELKVLGGGRLGHADRHALKEALLTDPTNHTDSRDAIVELLPSAPTRARTMTVRRPRWLRSAPRRAPTSTTPPASTAASPSARSWPLAGASSRQRHGSWARPNRSNAWMASRTPGSVPGTESVWVACIRPSGARSYHLVL